MNITATLGALASQNIILAYFIIYVATIFLGNVAAFVSFWIVIQGYLGVWGLPLLLLTIFVADISGDVLWYSLGKATRGTGFGRWIQRRFPWPDRMERMEQSLQNNGRSWIVFSKFLYASAFPVLFSVGWSGMPFKKFFRNSLLSVCVWLPILLGLTYGLTAGLSPLYAVSFFKQVEVAFFVGLLLFYVLSYFLARVISKLFERRERRRKGGEY